MTKIWKFIRASLANVGYKSLENVTLTSIDADGTLYYTDNGKRMKVKYPSTTAISVDTVTGFLTFSLLDFGQGVMNFEIDGTELSYTVPLYLTSDQLIAYAGWLLPVVATFDSTGTVTYLSNSATTTPTEVTSSDTINWLLDYNNVEYYLRGLKVDDTDNNARLKFIKYQTQWYIDSLTLLTSGYGFVGTGAGNFCIDNKTFTNYFDGFYTMTPYGNITLGDDGEITDFTLTAYGEVGGTTPTAITEIYLNPDDSGSIFSISSATFASTWSNELQVLPLYYNTRRAMVGYPYNTGVIGPKQPETLGGSKPFDITIENGILPPGITIVNDIYSGTPTSAGTYNFDIKVTDYFDNVAQTGQSILVYEPFRFITGSGNTGTTELPSGVTYQTYNEIIETTECVIRFYLINGSTEPVNGISLGQTNSGLVLNGTPKSTGTFEYEIYVECFISDGADGYVNATKTYSIEFL
jgi:hypothetical protein